MYAVKRIILYIYIRHISRFSFSMNTSRKIRVGTRIYVIRTAGTSQEHAPVCTTRKKTWDENDMVLVLVSKLTWSCG